MNIVSELYNRIENLDLWEKSIVLERNKYLAEHGAVEKKLYYVVSGSLKVCMRDGVEEHIVRFGYEGDFITSLDSFISGKPSDFYIQAIKRTEVKVISKAAYLSFVELNPANRQLWQEPIGTTTRGKPKCACIWKICRPKIQIGSTYSWDAS